MLKRIKIAAASAVIGLSALAAVPAQADSFYFGISPDGPRAGVVVDQGHSYRRHDDRFDRHDRRFDRRFVPGCSPWEAVRKADRMGINRAHVRYETRHSILVSGRSHGRHVSVTFAKAPRCPIIR